MLAGLSTKTRYSSSIWSRLPKSSQGNKTTRSHGALLQKYPRLDGHPYSSSRSLSNSSSSQTRKNIVHETLVPSTAQRRTIYALSTPPGKAGIAVIRVSGPDALQVWHRMVKTRSRSRRSDPEPWKLERCHIVDSQSGELLDDGLAVFFRGKSAYPRRLRIHAQLYIQARNLSRRKILSSCISTQVAP